MARSHTTRLLRPLLGGPLPTTVALGAYLAPSAPKNALSAIVHVAARSEGRRSRFVGILAASVVALVLTAGAQGAAPALTLPPTSLTFGSQATGTTSAPQQATATNTGTASLFFNSVQIRGADPLDFTIVDDQCSGVTLAAGASCTISVTFSPTTTGTRSANVTFTDTLRGGSGTMAQYNMGDFGVRRDSVQVYSSLPDAGPFQQILIGGSFS